MTDEKDIKLQINEYHKLLEELRAENINLPDEFVAGVLIEKLPGSWNDYKQHLKHKQKQMSLTDLITHIIIEDTNRKAIQAAKAKEAAVKANLVEDKPHSKDMIPNIKRSKSKNKILITSLRILTPNLKRKEIAMSVESLVTMQGSAGKELWETTPRKAIIHLNQMSIW